MLNFILKILYANIQPFYKFGNKQRYKNIIHHTLNFIWLIYKGWLLYKFIWFERIFFSFFTNTLTSSKFITISSFVYIATTTPPPFTYNLTLTYNTVACFTILYSKMKYKIKIVWFSFFQFPLILLFHFLFFALSPCKILN